MLHTTEKSITLPASAIWIVAATLGILLTHGQTLSAAHPFHMSTAYIEVSKDSGDLEVALKIHGDDLQVALSKLNSGQKVSIDEMGAADRLIEQYLRKHFRLAADEKQLEKKIADANGKAKNQEPLKLVGTEFTKSWLWVFFEIDMPDEEYKTAVLQNSLLLGSVESQINTAQFRNTKGRFAVRTSDAKPVVELKREWLSRSLAIPKDKTKIAEEKKAIQ